MNWFIQASQWYFVLLIIGIIFVPFVNRIFGKFFLDLGYPIAKTLAILLSSYALFIAAAFKILPFTQANLILILFIFSLINIFLLRETPIRNNKPATYIFIIFEEILFFSSFIFWVFVRGHEPSIRGLEKFMDFGFINSILRSNFFPPLDIWLSADPAHSQGYPINYYYFGHITGAFLIKLTGIKASVGYNLILATIFAQGVTQVFSLIINIIYRYIGSVQKSIFNTFNYLKLVFFGLIGSFIVNLGGNLHTIYTFTKGYPNENPLPFWQILSSYNPTKYWYPNATRFIPFTIHEFPSYSYVVADLHGHVFDIPFVLLTLAFLFLIIVKYSGSNLIKNFKFKILNSVFMGFLLAIHYMTNAFDGPIYFILTVLVFIIIFKKTKPVLIYSGITALSFILFSLPFSTHFSPFVGGISLNCSPDFLVNLKNIGPFLFEKDKCQISPLWMMFILWGFFWVNFILFTVARFIHKIKVTKEQQGISQFIFILFGLGTLLVFIPEFFYIKDIYPAHFRANTMFKLGYQSFIIMGIASSFTFFFIKNLGEIKSLLLTLIFIFFFFFISIYPSFSIPSYYGNLTSNVELNGSKWLDSSLPQDKEIIEYINKNIKGQPVILEAQGDSYTDFERISAYTGNPTVAGWWVHEWLWRGSSDVVGKRIPDISSIYESEDINLTLALLKKYKVKYVVVSKMEKQKYLKLKEDKFSKIATLIFQSTNKSGSLYQVK